MRILPAAICISLALTFGGPPRGGLAQPDVGRVVYDNPIVGFSLTIPEDWDMATGVLGDTVITMNSRTPSPLAPALSFFYMRGTPEEGAEQLAQFLVAMGRGLGVDVQHGLEVSLARVGPNPLLPPTGKPDEEDVRLALSAGPPIGDVVGRWLCRQEKGTTYVIGMIAGRDAAEQFKDDIDTAFSTCHLIDRAAVHYFREPTENGYRLMLPYDWRWEGSIYRDVNVPGWFVLRAQRADGLVGCFESPPVQAMTTYIDAQTAAGGFLLNELRKQVPDLQLESVRRLPRAGEHLAYAIRAATAAGSELVAERARADYVGTANGTRVRIRVDISLDFAPLLIGGGSETIWVNGGWAPVDKFDSLFPLARGVTGSLWETPEWRRNVRAAASAAMKGRMGAMEESAEDWDRYLREVDLVKDPAGGEPQEVPYGPGDVWKDQDGKMYRVPSSQPVQSELSRLGWKPLQ